MSPGGAAESAGLKAGDVLTDINGTALKRDGDQSAREKLLRAMRKVKPGDTVALSYRRDNKVLKASLVAQPLTDRFFTMAMPRRSRGDGRADAAHAELRASCAARACSVRRSWCR